MTKNTPSNHGEGDPQAADRFNSAERAFVDSARGKKKIKEGPKISADEEAELSKAERIGLSHARDDAAKSS